MTRFFNPANTPRFRVLSDPVTARDCGFFLVLFADVSQREGNRNTKTAYPR